MTIRTVIFLFAGLVWGLCAFAQAPFDRTPILLGNPSFEDIPRQAYPPNGWSDCGFPDETAVDVHPASVLNAGLPPYFGVTQQAIDGNTFLGMVVRDNETYEAVSQRLRGGPMKAGSCYTFSIFLARSRRYISKSRRTNQDVNYDEPVKLRIYGGGTYCERGQLLAESEPVKNEEWMMYTFRLEPEQSYSFLVLEAYYKTPVLFPYNGNLLLDRADKIIPIPCDSEDLSEEELLRLAEVPVTSARQASPNPEPRRTPPARKTSTYIQPKPKTSRPTRPAPPVASTFEEDKKKDVTLQGLSREEMRTGSVIQVQKLFFQADSSAVKPQSMPVLDELFNFLEANPDVVVEIGGHTNGNPPHAYCDRLSALRAQEVVNYLISRGIASERLFPKGYGKRKPIATNRTPAGRRKNQRVELKILSMESK